jgi:hypothetical protein
MKFTDVLNVWMRPWKCINYSSRYHFHNLSPPGYETDSSFALASKTRQFQIHTPHPPFNYSYCYWLAEMLNFTTS